jgi:zinc protease
MENLNLVLGTNFWEDPSQKFTLDNGLTILFQEDTRTELCSLQYFVRTGSIHEGELLGSGISHFLEHMVFKGTKDYTGDQIISESHKIGGSQNAYTSFDRTVYYLDCPAAEFKKGLDILTNIVFHPIFPEDEFEKEKEVILREIDMNEDDPDRVLSRLLFTTAFRSHPYRLPVIGRKESFLNLKREDLIHYHETRYCPENIILAVGGKILPDDFFNYCKEILAPIPRRTTSTISLPVEKQQLAPREEFIEKDLQLTRTAIAYPIPCLGHNDAVAFDLLANISGQGQSSLLWKKLREEKQLVHYIDAQAWTPSEGNGLFFISFITDHDKTEEAIDAVKEIFEQLPTQSDLESRMDRAKKQVLVSEVRSRKTVSGITGKMGNSEFSFGTTNFTQNYLKRLGKITKDELLRITASHIQEELQNRVTLGPKKEKNQGIRANEVQKKELQIETLDNGNQLILIEDDSLPVTQFTLVTRGGPITEPTGKSGLSALFANLLTKGTQEQTAEEIAELVESNGIQWSHFSGKNSLGLSSECLCSDAHIPISLLINAWSKLKLDPKRFEIEKQFQIASLQEEQDEIFETGRKKLHSAFFKNHFLGKNSTGEIEDLQKITLEDVISYQNQALTSQKWILAIGGKIPERKTLQPLIDLIGKQELKIKDLDIAFEYENESTEVQHFNFDRKQTITFQAYPCTGILDSHYEVCELIEEYLGSSAGILFREIREKRGLAYYAGITRTLGLKSGMVYLYAGTEKSKAKEVFDIFDQEIEKIIQGEIDEDHIERCKTSLITSKQRGLQTINSKTTQSALNALYGLQADDWNQYESKIRQISTRQLIDFSRTSIFGQKPTRVSIGQ